MLAKLQSQLSPRDKLQRGLKDCQHPLTSFLGIGVLVILVFTVIVNQFFPNILWSFTYFLFLVILLFYALRAHFQTIYSDLALSIYQFHKDRLAFLKREGERCEEVIEAFSLFYEDNAVRVHFHYKGQAEQLSLSKEELPQAYSNQKLVVIARHQTLSEEHLTEYLSQFDTRDLAQDYQTILQASKLRESTLISESDILQLSEAPQEELVTFHLALISQANESETTV